MNTIGFRAIGIAMFGGLAAFLAFGPAAAKGLQILALLLGWASYLHLGGGLKGLGRTLIHNLAGAAFGFAAVAFADQYAAYGKLIGFPAWAAVGVAVALGVLAVIAKLSPFGDLVGALLGFAAIAGAAQISELNAILTPSLANPAVGAVLSLMAGAIFAFAADASADAVGALRVGKWPKWPARA